MHALRCFFVNARGLVPKIELLRNYAITMNLDIIGIAETFLVKDVMQAEISIDGFTSYRKDRNSFEEGKAGAFCFMSRMKLIHTSIVSLIF